MSGKNFADKSKEEFEQAKREWTGQGAVVDQSGNRKCLSMSDAEFKKAKKDFLAGKSKPLPPKPTELAPAVERVIDFEAITDAEFDQYKADAKEIKNDR